MEGTPEALCRDCGVHRLSFLHDGCLGYLTREWGKTGGVFSCLDKGVRRALDDMIRKVV